MDLIAPLPDSGSSPAILISAESFIAADTKYHVSACTHTSHRFVGDSRLLPSVPFIGIDLEQLDDEVLASFAGICMSGDDEDDAIEALLAMLGNVLEIYSLEEESLGPEPRRQLDLLRQYIRSDG